MNELECGIIFLTLAVVGFLVKSTQKRRLGETTDGRAVQSILAGWSSLDFHRDPASRLLLGLGDGTEAAVSFSPAVAPNEANERREQIVFSFATGGLLSEMQTAFNKTLRESPGVAASLEAYRALHAFVGKRHRALRVRRSYKRSKLMTLWSYCTLPSSKKPVTSSDAPCLLLSSPDVDSATLEIEGSVISAAGSTLHLNLGEESGLAVGDLVQVERQYSGDWIGSAVIQSLDGTGSVALYAGSQSATAGDRARVTISSRSIWEGLPE